MVAHDHRERVPGCYRCELSRDEIIPAMELEIEDLEANVAALSSGLRMLRQDYRSKIVTFESRIRTIDKLLDEHGDDWSPPSVEEMRGAFPDITDGVDSVEFVRQQRARRHT